MCSFKGSFFLHSSVKGTWSINEFLISPASLPQSLSRVQLFVNLWTVARQAPLPMEFSRQEYWSGLPFPSPGDLPHLGIKPCSSAFQADSLLSELPGKPSSVQFSYSAVSDSATPWTIACQASLSITNSKSLLKPMSIESVMPSNHLNLCCPLLLPSTFPRIRVFSNESVLHIRRPKYWSFSFGISHSNKYSGLISFRMDWFDLLAVQGTLKSFLSFLYSPILTSIHDYWKNHSFD